MKRFAEGLGIAILIVAGLVYYWTERVADPSLLRGSKKIEIHSTAGAVDIVGVEGGDVEVSVAGASASARGAEVKIDRQHVPMRVDIRHIPQNMRVEVRVPADASVAVNMSAGELRISGVQGDIGSLLRSGKMVVELDSSDKILSADASVLAGEVQSSIFNRNKGGLFRRFVWRGHGTHRLLAHVSTGQLVVQ